MKLLIVDDSRVMRRMISGAAEVIGYETIEAGNGREALETLTTEAPQVAAITLDVTMPEMDGIECLRALKTDQRFAHIPVIMISAESEREILLEAIQLGARHYVTKPFTPEEVTTRLMEVLDIDDEF